MLSFEMWWHVTHVSWFVTSVVMTKLANSFDLLLHDFFAIMHVNSEAKVLPKAASKGDRRLSYLNVIVVFFTSFHTHCHCIFCIRNKVHLILLVGTEPKFWILNRTRNRAKVSNSIDNSVNRYTPNESIWNLPKLAKAKQKNMFVSGRPTDPKFIGRP